MTALVTGGQRRGALACVRALGRAEVAVCIAASQNPALAVWSRYATSSLLLPESRTHPERFIESLAAEAHGRSITSVLPTSDEDLWAIASARDAFPASVSAVLAPTESLAKIFDRRALFELARSLNIECVQTLRIEPEGEFEPVLRKARHHAFPQVVRPLPTSDITDAGIETYVANDIKSLRKLFYERPELQTLGATIEPSPTGRSVGYGCLVTDAGVHLEITRERVHERRSFSGHTTLSTTIDCIERVKEKSLRLLKALNYRGAAMVEWSYFDDVYRLTGVVPRLWDSVQLAIDAGANLPLMMHRLCEGREVQKVVAQSGHSLRWWLGDVERTLSRTFAHAAIGGLRGRLSTVVDAMSPRFLGGARGDVFDIADPLPFAFDVQGAVKAVGRTLKLSEDETKD